MSTPSQPDSILATALAGIDAAFRSRLIASYLALKDAVRQGQHDRAGLNVGKFCETCLRLVQQVTTGTHTPFAQQITNFADECRKVITATASATAPESLRVIVPRALVFAYTMRNKRGIGHVGGDVDANDIDVATMTRVADWIICELIRVYHKLSLEEAQGIVDGLAARDIPDIWEVGDKKRVLAQGLTAKQKTLLLLHSEGSSAVLDDDLLVWIEYDRMSTYRRDVLRPLHSERSIEYDEELGTVRISPSGVRAVESWLRERADGRRARTDGAG